jgi:hypothetical protein
VTSSSPPAGGSAARSCPQPRSFRLSAAPSGRSC